MNALPGIERGLVVANPSKEGTRAFAQAGRQIDFLANVLGIELKYIQTVPDALDTRRSILAEVRPTDLVLAKGGDGTLNVAANALLDLEDGDRPALVQVPAGTAVDYFRSLNGHVHGDQAMHDVLTRGKRIAIRAMNVKIENEDGSVEEISAMDNVGFHYPADFAQMLNEEPHRNGWLRRNVPYIGLTLQEALTLYRSLQHLSTVNLYDEKGGTPQPLVGKLLMHARVVAKYGKPNVLHTDDEFVEIDTVRPTRLAVCQAAGRLALGKAGGRRLAEVTFLTDDKNMRGQVDGEVFDIRPRSQVTTTLSDKRITTYSLLAAA